MQPTAEAVGSQRGKLSKPRKRGTRCRDAASGATARSRYPSVGYESVAIDLYFSSAFNGLFGYSTVFPQTNYTALFNSAAF